MTASSTGCPSLLLLSTPAGCWLSGAETLRSELELCCALKHNRVIFFLQLLAENHHKQEPTMCAYWLE